MKRCSRSESLPFVLPTLVVHKDGLAVCRNLNEQTDFLEQDATDSLNGTGLFLTQSHKDRGLLLPILTRSARTSLHSSDPMTSSSASRTCVNVVFLVRSVTTLYITSPPIVVMFVFVGLSGVRMKVSLSFSVVAVCIVLVRRGRGYRVRRQMRMPHPPYSDSASPQAEWDVSSFPHGALGSARQLRDTRCPKSVLDSGDDENEGV